MLPEAIMLWMALSTIIGTIKPSISPSMAESEIASESISSRASFSRPQPDAAPVYPECARELSPPAVWV
jgi:hypothetical protein